MAKNDVSKTDHAAAGAADAVSAYEAKRLQRIQQNQQMLQSLGIAVQPRERKRRIFNRDDNAEPVEPRRSFRLQQQPTAPETAVDVDRTLRRVRRARGPEHNLLKLKLPTVEEKQLHFSIGHRTRQSSTTLDMDMTAFHDRWLGKQIWPKGKVTVMEGMCPQHVPSFSMMLGIQQWRNGVALFVNVHSASGYDNTFTDTFSTTTGSAGVYFRWFAQDRQHEASPAIVRLVAAQAGDQALWLDGAVTPPPSSEETEKTISPEPVLLFVRHVKGPYIYCGRLGYLGHLREPKPMEFRWQLLDVNKIQWSDVKELLDQADPQTAEATVETASLMGEVGMKKK